MTREWKLMIFGTAWLVLAGMMLYLASMDVLPEVQFVWTVSAVIIMIVIRFFINRNVNKSFEPLYFGRILIVLLAGMIALRYLWWRTFHSLPLDSDIISLIGGLLLYAAEIQATLIFFLGSFLYIYPRKRDPMPLPEDRSTLPTVDVLVPTYNEPLSMLRLTLLACTNLKYPSDKLNIYMLDDGGTVQFRNQEDERKARAAQLRHEQFKALCKELGVNYLTREKNEDAKAGNINTALKKIHGDLVLIFDCDHVPTVDFLENTVAPFMKDEKLWLVQTPHFLINDDPIEKNLGTSSEMPSESELFYTSALRGMDSWNAVFFCGSAGIIRRKFLDELGGLCTETVTEDIETSVEMHRKGYNSVYFHKPMLAGLQPETFTGFLTQRLRWTHGMLQVFMMKNPLVVSGLGIWQRLCYLNMTGYWLFSIMRLVFLLSPTAYLVFGIRLYDASVNEIMLYAFPHLIAFVIYFNVFFGRTRWFLVSDVYETLQSLFAVRTVFKVLLHPERGHFNVTPKDENITEDFITPVARVFHLLLIVLGFAVLVGIYKIFFGQDDALSIDIAITFWAVLSFLVTLASVGALFERKQVRRTTRFRAEVDAILISDEGQRIGRSEDMSAYGMRLKIQGGKVMVPNSKIRVKVYCKPLEREIELNAIVRVSFPFQAQVDEDTIFPSHVQSKERISFPSQVKPDECVVGLDFSPQSLEEEKLIVALTYGNSERWREALMGRNTRLGLWDGVHYFVTRCLPLGVKHVVRQTSALFGGKITFVSFSFKKKEKI